ncbi:hypothetical protein [Variovorax fucosicus]|uniref:hypothetical protein n=1 Tax=Variovorax fucosicus TaxID=3053517 RepID=UPI0025766799|nr:hypothetical protein [Variovorax sp. J22G47]MDM0059246.1 hypothetical protein [Variovorax sp. J22G47]
MRVLVLALAILLLPLRGWLGDAMAVQSVQPQQTMSAEAGTALHAMHDMAGMTDMAHDHGSRPPAAHAPATPDCKTTCTDCQLCHTVAMTVWPELALLGAAPRETPSFRPVVFASAEPARGFKPPIS